MAKYREKIRLRQSSTVLSIKIHVIFCQFLGLGGLWKKNSVNFTVIQPEILRFVLRYIYICASSRHKFVGFGSFLTTV